MNPPSRQAVEAANEIAAGLGAASNCELQAEFAAIIDAKFAGLVEAGEKIAETSSKYRETFIRCIGDPSIDHEMENADDELQCSLAAYAAAKGGGGE